jgi:SAM-dependent methyltransferase
MNTTETIETQLHRYLLDEAERKGFSATKTHVWVNGMRDLSRGQTLVPKLLSEFKTQVRPNERALDIGCGFGGVVVALQQHFSKVCALDIVEERVAWTKKRAGDADVVRGSVTRMPWDDDSFRLAIANDVFEHITHAQQHVAAAEIFRVLSPGGSAYVEVPNRLQLIDEHNFVPFGTWLPTPLRRQYVKAVSRERGFVECWERTGYGWKALFEAHGFAVRAEPFYLKNVSILPAHHWKLFLTKPSQLS